MFVKQLTKVAALAALALTPALPAAAQTTLTGGAFSPVNDDRVGGAVLSTSLAVPGAPAGLEPQLSLAAPLAAGSRYSLTGEVRSTGPQFIGVGAGIGKLDPNGRTGFVVDGLVGTRIAPNTALVGRIYGGSRATGTNSFVGVQLRV
jgi:hypothetical protein